MFLKALGKAAVLTAAAIAIYLPVNSGSPVGATAPLPTVILVHGAFADGSSWDKVVEILESKNVRVVAVQNPLTSLADDVAVTQRAIADAPGPVLLVGHSWAGAVITQAGMDAKVKGLVYVAAGAPDAGQSFAQMTKPYPDPAGNAGIHADAAGFLTMTAPGVRDFFAPDLPAGERSIIAATQGAIAARCFSDKVTVAAWRSKPSWFVVARHDQMIQPDLERALARKMKAKTTEVDSSHVAMLAKPDEVASVILGAANSIRR